jgi:hypothetical protein
LGPLAVVTLVAAGLLAGCGGGSTATTSTTTLVVKGKPEAAQRAVHKQHPKQHQAKKRQRQERRKHHHSGAVKTITAPVEKTVKPRRKAKPSAAESTSPAAASPAGNSLGGASPVAVRKLRKHCPKGVDAKSCTALIEAFVTAQGAESQPIASPEECTETRSKAECEVVLKQQSESEGEAVSVQECLAKMTPKCEELLRPLFESQQASEAAGG